MSYTKETIKTFNREKKARIHKKTRKYQKQGVGMDIKRGCIVKMKSSSGMQGWGNPQCVERYNEHLGEVSLFGHNQNYKDYDIEKVLEYPAEQQIADLQRQLEKAEEELRIQDMIYRGLEKEILALSKTWDEHPEDYNGACNCATCMSYAD